MDEINPDIDLQAFHNNRKLQRQRSLNLYGGRCCFCGEPHATTLDHLVPLAKGGYTSFGNLLPACSRCNHSKSDKNVWDYYNENHPFYDANRAARLEEWGEPLPRKPKK